VFIGLRRFALYNGVAIVNAATALLALVALMSDASITVADAARVAIAANVAALAGAVWAHRKQLAKVLASAASVPPAAEEAYRVGIKAYISAIAFLVLYRLDFFFVAFFLGSRALGVYSISVFVIEAIQKISDWLGLMLAPQVAAQGDSDGDLSRRYTVLAVGSVVMCSLAVAVFAWWGDGLLSRVLGEGYQGVASLLLMLLPRALLHAIMATKAAYLAGSGYTFYHPAAGLAGVGVLCLVDIAVIPRYQLLGAVGGITAAYVVATAVMWIGCRSTQRRAIAAT
jgi:O-antigen/teichoic acid export membrane protein